VNHSMLKAGRVLAIVGALVQPLCLDAANSTVAAQLEQRAAQFFKADQPGGVVYVRRGDEVLLRQAYGLADLENQRPAFARSTEPALHVQHHQQHPRTDPERPGSRAQHARQIRRHLALPIC